MRILILIDLSLYATVKIVSRMEVVFSPASKPKTFIITPTKASLRKTNGSYQLCYLYE